MICQTQATLTVAGGCSPVPTQQFNVALPGASYLGIAWRSNPPPADQPNHSPLLCAGGFDDKLTTINLDDQTLTTLGVSAGLEPAAACYCPVNDKFIFWCWGTHGIIRVTPEPLAIFDSLPSAAPNNAIAMTYNTTNGLVYINAVKRLVVYNPVTNSVVASVLAPTGGTSQFAGGISIDEPGKRLWIGYQDNASFSNNEGLVQQWNIAGSTPTLVSTAQLPLDSGNGCQVFNVLWCPTNGLVYCCGQDSASNAFFVTRYHPSTGLFTNTAAVGSIPSGNSIPLYNPASDLIIMPNESVGGAEVYCPSTDAIIGAVSMSQPQQGCLSRGGAIAYVGPSGVISYL